MKIEQIHVKSLRSILDETLPCENLTILVGANGAGKSSFLKAIDLFYARSPKVEVDDFYNRDTTKEIVISVTFGDLSASEAGLFSKYVQDNKLTVERIFNWSESKPYTRLHGATLQNPNFASFRRTLVEQGAKQAKLRYDKLKLDARYSILPNWTNVEAAKQSLAIWESTNPQACARVRDDGQFFGFTEVGQGYLGRFSMLRYVQAVRDASIDSTDKGNSTINEIMELVVRNSLSNRSDIQEFKRKTASDYAALFDPSKC